MAFSIPDANAREGMKLFYYNENVWVWFALVVWVNVAGGLTWVLVLRHKLVRLIQTRVKFVFIAWLKLTSANCPNGRSPLVGRTTSALPRGLPLWLIIS